MFRRYLFTCLILSVVAAARDERAVPPAVRELLADNMIGALNTLTRRESVTLNRLLGRNFTSDEEVYAFIKRRSPTLYSKLDSLLKSVRQRIAALGPEARRFVTQLQSEVIGLHQSLAGGREPTLDTLGANVAKYLDIYKTLSAAAKADLKKQLPLTSALIERTLNEDINFPKGK
ncbi:hypothetical protein Q1695_016079 [Nippostrongylus brasiliensis]|nr:hypothetical protein Q1695_016079 [Nippostrongylus brasiliensis]